ncbi:hypothetical protein K437DRAFT_63521 [Tilletiaria anomala UBC 951]|uniref:Uncharacterized protein n=1 Tax=Tilletiaria anomala (strain ATCC 24038 / CBS 436.72 / UBC 951) TaxID=1037660 RepID=A0A066VBW4_TILAU|nr:uncharacterized protein K437DRAFT_63521 [Tilletiaria anomala UBC 951]KDN36085.1 hypothetical protein K437DRAFT_63521 [Tilletiaria anomala UBC 951]
MLRSATTALTLGPTKGSLTAMTHIRSRCPRRSAPSAALSPRLHHHPFRAKRHPHHQSQSSRPCMRRSQRSKGRSRWKTQTPTLMIMVITTAITRKTNGRNFVAHGGRPATRGK